MNLPTNRSFSVRRGGQMVLQDLNALILPAGAEVLVKFDIPAKKAYQVTFAGNYHIQEQDTLISQADETETYRVRGVERYDTPRAAHTEAVVEGMWGEH